jgi:2-oxoglutarate ferredoxin oxidoreductase subunit beta
MGSADHPVTPLMFALGADATFVGRTIDVEAKHQQDLLKRAAAHKGASIIEILQNCNVYNDGAWAGLTDRETKADAQLVLEHGKPMIFGKNKDKGIRLKDMKPEVVALGNGISASDLLVHDEANPVLGFLVSRMAPPEFPTPIGVVRVAERPSFDELINRQLSEAQKAGAGDLEKLMHSGDVWTVK